MGDGLEQSNLYFKFFDDSELSKKRLLYNELYFLSRDEINDPYDINVEKTLEGTSDQLGRIFQRILSEIQKETSFEIKFNMAPFTDFLCANPISNNTLGIINTAEFFKIIYDCLRGNDLQQQLVLSTKFVRKLRDFLTAYLADAVYIVSFSKVHDNVLMWSHYANAHKGFCLIFSAINGSLYQDHRNIFDFLKTSPNTSSFVGKQFEFRPVTYEPTLATLNGFISLPGGIYGEPMDEAKRNEYWENYRLAFLRKSKDWEYEKEHRLLLTFLMDRPRSRLQRLFHYDVSQITGMIFGNKMKQDYADDLVEIILRQREALIKLDQILPPFVFYRAEIDHRNFRVIRKPIMFYDRFNKVDIGERWDQEIENYHHSMKHVEPKGTSAHFLEELDFLRTKDMRPQDVGGEESAPMS